MSDFDSLLQTLQTVLQSDLVVSLFILAVGVFLFAFFLSVVVTLTYAAAFTWAGFESRYKDADEDAFQFDEYEIVDVALAQLTALWTTIASFVALLFGSVRSVAQTLVNNLLLVLLVLFAFVFVVIWDTFHAELLQAASETYSCFLAPLARSLLLPLV